MAANTRFCLDFPVFRRGIEAPDVVGLLEFDAIVGGIVGRGKDDAGSRGFASTMNKDRDDGRDFKACGSLDESTVKVNDHSFTGIGELLAFDFDEYIGRDSRAAAWRTIELRRGRHLVVTRLEL